MDFNPGSISTKITSVFLVDTVDFFCCDRRGSSLEPYKTHTTVFACFPWLSLFIADANNSTDNVYPDIFFIRLKITEAINEDHINKRCRFVIQLDLTLS